MPTGWTITGGQNTTQITVTTGAAGQDGNISVTAGNTCGTSGPSSLAVRVTPTPVVTNNPSLNICNGDNTNITFTASTPSTFTWTLGTITGGITGASANSGSLISQVLTNPDLNTAGTVPYIVTPTSTDGGCAGNPYTITVRVNAPVAIVTQPVSDTTCATLPVSFVVSATGTGLTYQWYNSVVGALTDDANISGSQAAELDIDQADAGDVGTYWVVVSGTSPCGPVESDHVNLVINKSITINTQPQPQTVCAGGTAVFTIDASSATGVTYQWKKGTTDLLDGPIGDGAVISGAATSTLTITGVTAAEAATNYNALVISPGGNDCNQAKSKIVKLSVNPIPTADQLSDVIVCNGFPTGLIHFTGSAAGTVYDWLNSDPSIGLGSSGTGDISSFNAINTGSSLVTATITVTPKYTNSGIPAATCTGAQMIFHIKVNPTPKITATPASNEICSGSSTSIALSSNVTTATFSWMVVQTGASGASASSGNLINQTLTATGTSQGTAVYTITSLADGCTSTQTVTVKVNPIPTVIATPSGKTICSGTAPSIALTSNVPGATFKWTVVQTNVTGASDVNGSNTISQVLTATTASQGQAVYTVTPTFNSCSGNPITVTIKVNPAPAISDYSTSICSGNAVSYTPPNGSGNIIPTGTTYTWSAPVVAGVTGTISGTDQSSFNSGALVNSTANPIDVVYTIFPTAGAAVGGCTGNSFKVIVTVKPVPSVSVTPASKEICSGANFTIAVASVVPGTITSWSVAGGAYPANITSSIGTSGSGTINNATMSNSSTTGTAIPVTFNVTIQATSSGCITTTSVIIRVDAPLTAPVIAASQILCYGASPTPLTSTISGGRGNYTYKWQKSTSSTGPWSLIVGANSATYTPPRPNALTYYQLVVTDDCGTATSNIIQISTGDDFGLTFNTDNTPSVLCAENSFHYSTEAISFGSLSGNRTIRYAWQSIDPGYFTSTATNPFGTTHDFLGFIYYFDGDADFKVHNSTNAPVSKDLVITPKILNADGSDYCNLTADIVTVAINPVPVIANSTTSTCSGTAFTYSPVNGSPAGNVVPTNTTYTWMVPANSLGATTQNTAQSSISQTLTNNTGSPQTVRYTVTPSYTGSPTPNCPGNNFFLDVTVNPTITAGTLSGPSSLCKDVTTTIGTFSSNGTPGGIWSSSDQTVATVNSSTGVVTTINAGTTNITYKFNAGSGCGTPVSSSKQLIVNDDVTAGTITGTPTSICIGGTTQYSTNGTTGGTWTSDGTAIATVDGTGKVTGVGAGTTTIRYTLTFGCNPSPAFALRTITVNRPSIAPTTITSSGTICKGNNIMLTVGGGTLGTGAVIKWYTGSCGGTAVGTGATITVSPTTTTTYYARYEDPVPCNINTTCLSTTVTVNQPSLAPTTITSSGTICKGNNIMLTVGGGTLGTGAVIKWYTGSCGGIAIGTGATITVNPITTTTYYARYEDPTPCNTTTTCLSTTVTVNQPSLAPTTITSSGTICKGNNIMLTVGGGTLGTGAVIKWYTGSCGGIAIGTGATITVSPTTTTIYYARFEDPAPCNTSTTCLSTTVTVNGNTWTGIAGIDWSNPANWCGNIVPTGASDAIIPSVPNLPVLTSSVAVNNLTMQSGATLTLTGNTLTINGTYSGTGTLTGSSASGLVVNTTSNAGTIYFTPNDFANNKITNNYLKALMLNSNATATIGDSLNIAVGTFTDPGSLVVGSATGSNAILHTDDVSGGGVLTLKSNVNGDARVAESYGTIKGNVVVERYIPPRRAWRFVTAPVKSNQTINQSWQEGQVNTAYYPLPGSSDRFPGYGTEITNDNLAAHGYDLNTTTNPSIRYWDPAANDFLALPQTGGTLTTMLNDYSGYYLFVRGSRAINLSQAIYAPPDPTVLRANGTLGETGINSNKVSINSGTMPANSYLFVGNPYASAIKLSDVLHSRITGFKPDIFWVWDPKINGSLGVGTYVAFSSGVWQTVGGSYSATDPPVIQSGQAFMVRLDNGNTSGSLEFDQVDKNITEANVFGIQQQNQQTVFHTTLMTPLGNDLTLLDGVAAAFGTSNSAGIDKKNASKKWNTTESIGLFRNNTWQAIEFRPVPILTDTLFYSLYYLNQKSYALQITAQDVPAGFPQAWLVDKYLNTKTALDISKPLTYSFTANSDVNSYRNRFMLVFKRQFVATPVPVTKVANQANPGTTGNANSIATSKSSIDIYPNPIATGEKVTLKFSNMVKGRYEVTITNTGGKALAEKTIMHDGGSSSHTLQTDSRWAAGSYILQITSENGYSLTTKLIISK